MISKGSCDNEILMLKNLALHNRNK